MIDDDRVVRDVEICPLCNMPTDDPAHLIWDRVWAALIAERIQRETTDD